MLSELSRSGEGRGAPKLSRSSSNASRHKICSFSVTRTACLVMLEQMSSKVSLNCS